MRRRILSAILGVSVLAIILFGVPLAIVVERFVDEEATIGLERQAVLAAAGIPADFAGGEDPVELPLGDTVTFGLYDQSGALVTGDGPAQADDVVLSALGNDVAQSEASGFRVVAIPVTSNENVIGAIRAAQPTSVADARTRRALFLLGGLALAVLAVGAAIASLVAGRLAKPVRWLSHAAVRLGGGDFGVTVEHTDIAELDEAGEAIVSTAKRLEDLISRERALSTDASHQIRTPLAALRTSIETEMAFPRPDRNDVLGEALVDIGRLESTIDDLLAFARTSGITQTTVELGPVLERLRADWNGPLAVQGRPLRVGWPHDLPRAIGNQGILRQALDSLVDNAAKHGAGEVRVEARFTPESVIISVADDGAGVGVNNTQPLHSADAEAKHGFGLPMARRLIEANQGRLILAHAGPRPEFQVVLKRPRPTDI